MKRSWQRPQGQPGREMLAVLLGTQARQAVSAGGRISLYPRHLKSVVADFPKAPDSAVSGSKPQISMKVRAVHTKPV